MVNEFVMCAPGGRGVKHGTHTHPITRQHHPSHIPDPEAHVEAAQYAEWAGENWDSGDEGDGQPWDDLEAGLEMGEWETVAGGLWEGQNTEREGEELTLDEALSPYQ